MVIRTQKERKLQTLIEVCTDFSSLKAPTHTHRPAEQTFAVHQPMEASFVEEDCESEVMFAVGDHPPWTGRGASEPSGSPTLQQMFALARRMGYEMRPIARQMDNSRQSQGNRPFYNQDRGFRSQMRAGRDYSKVKCFSCGQFGYMQSRCHDRKHPCHSNQRVGIYSLRVANRGMVTLHRETPARPGRHSHRSARASFGPHITFIHQLATGLFIT